jgi:hypothetical protein
MHGFHLNLPLLIHILFNIFLPLHHVLFFCSQNTYIVYKNTQKIEQKVCEWQMIEVNRDVKFDVLNFQCRPRCTVPRFITSYHAGLGAP